MSATGRRDRFGELIEDADDGQCCRAGWIDRDGDTPRPCLTHRPWLAERRPPTDAELADAQTTERRSS